MVCWKPCLTIQMNPRFTIEQIDLLQRLSVLEWLNMKFSMPWKLWTLDQEHSDKFGRRSSWRKFIWNEYQQCSSIFLYSYSFHADPAFGHVPYLAIVTTPPHSLVLPIRAGGRITTLSPSNGKMSPTRYHANMGQREVIQFWSLRRGPSVDDKVEELMRLVSFLFRVLQISMCLDWFWVIKLYFSSLHMTTVASLFPFGDKEKN